MRKASALFLCLGAASLIVNLNAHAPSGAIFTTLPDGSEVNFNHYPSKLLVYLDGGPGPGAPMTAAGLDDGNYVFQVTDPPGKTLLSTDKAKCRQFRVEHGVITHYYNSTETDPGGLSLSDCHTQADGWHRAGIDVDHGDEGAMTVQLMPFNDTPNNGGVYKAWIIERQDFLNGCKVLYETGKRTRGDQTATKQGLEVVDCGYNGGNAHGFVNSHSKTDNFKAKLGTGVREIDSRFFPDYNNNGHKEDNEPWLDGISVNWTDPVGGSNKKTSYWRPESMIFHEAHVEAIEDGVHKIELQHQAGCTVGHVHVDGIDAPLDGPQTIGIDISKLIKDKTWFIDVACVQ